MQYLDDQWTAVVRECQFAVAQFNRGAYQLCRVPIPTNIFTEMNHRAFNFHLYEGMLSVTTGLERLCKLTISAWNYLNEDEFLNVKRFDHKISELFEQIENIDIAAIFGVGDEPSGLEVEGRTDFESPLVDLMTYYASGKGRYEFLDSLAGQSSGVASRRSVSDDWMEIVKSTGPVPSWLEERCDYPGLMAEALQKMSNRTGAYFLETSVVSHFEFGYGAPLNSSSANVALICFEYAKWVSKKFDRVAHAIIAPPESSRFESRTFPHVIEILPSLMGISELWFEDNVLFVGDYETTVESIYDFLSEPDTGDTDANCI